MQLFSPFRGSPFPPRGFSTGSLSTLLILNFHIEKSLLVTLLDFLVLHKPATVRKPLSLNYISQ